ncbi:MAG: hypothetical protein PVJ84_11435 [Desulfobacteraceae bacterium]
MMKRRVITVLAVLSLLVLLLTPFSFAGHRGHGDICLSAPAVQLNAGDVWVVEETTRLSTLTLAVGAKVTVPEGYSLTLTVNGVETGSVLAEIDSVDTEIAPGSYWGCVVLTVTEENPVEFVPPGPPGPSIIYPFRQAIYLDETGIVAEKSVLSSVVDERRFRSPTAEMLCDPMQDMSCTFMKQMLFDPVNTMLIRSNGENFNGVFAADGTHNINNANIQFSGNGRSDFAGYAAAAMSTGENTTLVLDQVKIVAHGVARSAAIADHGSNLIVKNSYLQTYNGVMPEDYMPTIDMGQMRSVPWMLGLSGNNRATNLLGTNTNAAYINSYIGSEGWGVLSTDACTTPTLTAINSTIANTGNDGYGAYGIGDAVERFLGCNLNVATYAIICRDTTAYYGDSDPAVVAQLNTDLELGLTAQELRRIEKRPTIVNSKRFGVMWHGGGTVEISGGTIFNTGETTFLNKGQAISLTVDGAEGAQLNPGNGVILQVMDDDDPGPVFPSMHNTGVYDEPTGPVTPQAGHDLTIADDTDARATFSNIELVGDFYNSMRGDIAGPFGPATPRNMALTFVNAGITGVISAATSAHTLPHIEYPVGWDEENEEPYINEGHTEDYKYLGVVTNTPSEAVNNGVIVSLDTGSSWTVTGTCILTSLTIEEGTVITATNGNNLTMMVDGVETDIAPGIYAGEIVLTVE